MFLLFIKDILFYLSIPFIHLLDDASRQFGIILKAHVLSQ